VVVAVVAWLGLLFLSGFLWTKIAFGTQGTGWLYLPAFGACVVFVLVVRVFGGAQLVFGRSAPWLALFVFWFLIRLILDASTISDVLGYTIGYAEGILFAVPVGVAIRLLLDALSESAPGMLRWWAAMLLLAFNAWSAMQVEQAALAANKGHWLYSYFYNDTYQLSGALVSVLALILAALLVRSVYGQGRGMTRIRNWALVAAAALAFGVIVRLAQLLGSNSGPAFVVPVAVLALATVWVALKPRYTRRRGRRADEPLSFIRALGSVTVVAFCLLVTCSAAFLIAVASGTIDITRYRAFGFDEASLFNQSVQSRLHILLGNFPKHLAHSPILGNFFVHRLTTGEGTYAHGLLAIIPHLGMVGSALFLAMLYGVGVQLHSQWRESRGLQQDRRLALVAILLTLWSLSFLLLTTFFTNILLWLTLAMFAPAVRLRSCAVQ